MRSTLVVLVSMMSLCHGTVNYCGARMCGYTDEHTLCQYPVGRGPACAGYTAAPLTPEEKDRILTRLNRRRSHAATGQLRHLPTAADMLKLRWVEELAREAQRWADQCRPPQTPDEHDACRDLYSVSVGQSVASVVGEAPGLRVESMVDLWYMQSMHYKGNVTTYLPPMSIVNYYGDFAQIVWSYTYMVGCGRSRFMIQQQGRVRSVERLVCNFGPRGPISGQAIWIPEEPASLCPPRSKPDAEYPGLCAYQQYLDISNDTTNMTTVEENTLLDTVFEIETNDILNYPGSIDELYLTKIAIATLEDKAKTETYYNTFQKRDVVDKFGMNFEAKNNSQESLNGTEIANIQIQEGTNTKLKTTMKIKLIGRPKSYNADDLTDIGGFQGTENYEIPTELLKERKEFYADYQYMESQDSESFTENVTIISGITSLPGYEKTESFNMTPEMTVTDSNFSILNISYISETEVPLVNNANFNGSTENNNYSSRIQKEDEFLSDPETVRDLQEALNQMEQSMATTTVSAAPEKVKRDLRDMPREIMERKPKETRTLSPQLQDLNITVDKAPMLNMILRYLPYLKPYKNEILGKVTGAATSVSPFRFLCYCSVGVNYFLKFTF